MNTSDNDEKEGPIELTEIIEDNEQNELENTEQEGGVQAGVSEERDYDELYQRHLRLAADFENYKKRLAKEKADIIAYGNEELIKALLNVLDNLERALEHSDVQDDPKPLLEGVQLVHKQFLSCMEKFGVQFIDASRGQDFDPRLHQAIERVESPDITPGLIISEMLKGYMLKDRLLRPALVVVSKGAPGAGTAEAPITETQGAGTEEKESEQNTDDSNEQN